MHFPLIVAAGPAKSLQSCPTLCDLIDGNSPAPPHPPGILQAGTLEWAAVSFSSGWKWKVKGTLLSRVRLLATPWTAAHQAPPSMGFSRQEYWSGVPLPSPSLCQFFYSPLGSSSINLQVCAWVLRHVWLCDHMDCSLPASSVYGISQARILECVAIFFCGTSWPRDQISVSCISRQILYHYAT